MEIILAPNAMKGSLTACGAGEAMHAGIRAVLPEARVQIIPLSDGGDGLVDILASPLAAERRCCTVSGPLGVPTQAAFLHCPNKKLAVIEMATASGLSLLSGTGTDPLRASSRGTGELIRVALDLGCEHIVLGIGGSATTDGGTGIASALGVRFLDSSGSVLTCNGAQLANIHHIDRSAIDARLASVSLDIICDVSNPLLGEDGSARVYAPQKGATPAQVDRLEQGLSRLADVIENETGMDIRHLPGAGAGGGAGAGLAALLGATLKPGAQQVVELLGLETLLGKADLVMTCEGRLDKQTRFGKAPAAVAKLAKSQAVPCIAIAGSVDDTDGAVSEIGFSAIFSLCQDATDIEASMENAAAFLQAATQRAIHHWLSESLQGTAPRREQD